MHIFVVAYTTLQYKHNVRTLTVLLDSKTLTNKSYMDNAGILHMNCETVSNLLGFLEIILKEAV